MLKYIFIFLIFIKTNVIIFAQTDSLGKSNYDCKIWLIGRDIVLSGDLYEAGDTALLLKMVIHTSTYPDEKSVSLMTVPVSRIKKISFYLKGSMGKGMLIGGGIGFVTGALIGNISNDAETNSDSFNIKFDPAVATIGGGIMFMIPGMIVGGVIGSKTTKIVLDGDLQEYSRRKSEIASFSIRK